MSDQEVVTDPQTTTASSATEKKKTQAKPSQEKSAPRTAPPEDKAAANKESTDPQREQEAADSPPSGLKGRIQAWIEAHRQEFATYLLSLAVHGLILLVLAMIALPVEQRDQIFEIISSTAEEEEPIEELQDVKQPEKLEPEEVDSTPVEVNAESVADTSNKIDLDVNDLEPTLKQEMTSPTGPQVDVKLSNELAGRSRGARAALVKKYGGTAASEQAVASGLKWLAKIQHADGSWYFDDVGEADGAGNLHSPMGATSMALLCFLGAGHTHETKEQLRRKRKKNDDVEVSPYRETVWKGLSFLMSNMKATQRGGDLRGEVEGNEGMYVHGLGTIALAEAHGMTKDPRLRRATQAAVNFIINAQHHSNGGWRYKPGQKGDTSVVGWQVMALVSARAAQLPIPSNVVAGVSHFLDLVQAKGGAHYGYTDSQAGRPATTAVGLLCRMYLGWKKKNPALQQGVEWLSQRGPSKGNMYYNYYATQVLHHWSGEKWKKWNEEMRTWLVNSQVKKGPAKGSWDPKGGHSGKGGRIYMTSMAIMTLEVYYRHLPLYDRGSFNVEF